MTPQEWQRIKRIAGEAWEIPQSERAALIEARAEGDEALRRHVEALLRSATDAAELFEVPAITIPGAAKAIVVATGLPVVGTRIGPYRVIRELGHGGMGTVYLGQRVDGEFDHQVAIKLVGGFPSELLLERFRTERRILASLNHPNIAGLIDGGSTPEGFPYVIMEFVEGTPIDEYCERRGLSVPARIALFQRICEAVHHAHQQQIIHRDIKPGNILVTADGLPKLLDFGIAKILEPDGTPNARTAIRVLTPESASPEQTRGESVTAASDIYALGVLLYRLLTGRSPYGDPDSEEALVRAICEDTPKPPSVNHDLDLIVLKALKKDPSRRYHSVEEFSADLRRYATGHPVLAAPDSRPYRARKFVARHRVVLSVALAAMMIGMTAQWGLSRPEAAPPSIRSVAVFPFKPLVAADSDDNYLGVALADAMLTQLRDMRANVRPLNAGGHRNEDPLAAGRKLHADLVLDGAIQRTGDALHVRAYLVRVADGVTIWSDRFDEKWSDVFTVQDAIANQVARSLAITLSRADRQRFERRRTGDVEAYGAYLRGRYFWNLRTAAGLQRALTYFEQAIQKDPQFASAYAGLADTYALLGSIIMSAMPPAEAAARAKEAALKALELDPTLAEAEVSLAFVTYSFDWDWTGGEAHFRRAIDLDPDYVTAHYWYSLYLGQVGRLDEALLEAQRALDLEPLSLVGTFAVGLAHHTARRFDLARQYADKALEISPDFPLALRLLGRIAIAEGRDAEAVVDWQRHYEAAPGNSMIAAYYAHACGRAGDRAQARRILNGLVERSATSYVSPVNVAVGFIGLGDADAAFTWLERAYRERSQGLTYLKTDPLFDPLRSDPRFGHLLRRVGLTQ